MRVLILGEGPTDLGRTDTDGIPYRDGVLPILVCKLIEEAAPGTAVEVRALVLKPRRFPESARKMGRSRYGYANQLWALLGLKEGRWAEAVVRVVDRDGKEGKDRIAELNKGREALRREGKPCAVGFAIEMIEAWLLADEKALRAALGDDTIQRQPDPEGLAAGDEGSERHPKTKLTRLIQEAQGRAIKKGEFPDHYAAIATHADPHVLEDRCPQGFKPFAQQVRELSEP